MSDAGVRAALNATDRNFFYVGLGLLIVSFALTVYVVHMAFMGLVSHAPSGSFTIFDLPEGGNPQKLWDSYRIFFLHLPSALSAATASMLMGVGGLLYFISKHPRWESLTVAAAEMGIAACFITMATGYFWGDFAWGNGWTWEPRLTSALILWLSYIALLMIRAGIENPDKRRTITAAYGLLTVPLYPMVSRAIEIFGEQSHPASLKDLLGAQGSITELLSIAKPALILLFASFVILRYWQMRLRESTRQLEELIEEKLEA